MKWEKAPEELKALLGKALAGIDCEKKLMFGYPAYFINKNMFAGLFQSSVFLRLSPDQVSRLSKKYAPFVSSRAHARQADEELLCSARRIVQK